MILAKNYFEIDPKLYDLLFNEDLYQHQPIKQLSIVFLKGFESGGISTYLNYYNFNILLSQTKEQNNICHKLDDNFFNELSLHKNKLIFCGHISQDKRFFTPNKMIYLYPHKKLGIFVRKKIMSKFIESGLDVLLDKHQPDQSVTMFTIQ